jgi:hypothetical protein
MRNLSMPKVVLLFIVIIAILALVAVFLVVH